MKRTWLFALVGIGGLFVGVAGAQQYPLMDLVADKVISKYNSSSCEQLWAKKGAPPSQKEQEALEVLRNDPAMRRAFVAKVADTVVNKLFECGMFP